MGAAILNSLTRRSWHIREALKWGDFFFTLSEGKGPSRARVEQEKLWLTWVRAASPPRDHSHFHVMGQGAGVTLGGPDESHVAGECQGESYTGKYTSKKKMVPGCVVWEHCSNPCYPAGKVALPLWRRLRLDRRVERPIQRTRANAGLCPHLPANPSKRICLSLPQITFICSFWGKNEQMLAPCLNEFHTIAGPSYPPLHSRDVFHTRHRASQVRTQVFSGAIRMVLSPDGP